MHEAGKSTVQEDLEATEAHRRKQGQLLLPQDSNANADHPRPPFSDEINHTAQNSSKPKKRDKPGARGGSGPPQSARPNPLVDPRYMAVQMPRGPPTHPAMRPY